MDISSIMQFRAAIHNPETAFATLRLSNIDYNYHRTTHFVECSVSVDGVEAKLYVPITPRAMQLAHRANLALYRQRAITPTVFRIYHDEMIAQQLPLRRCSVIIEQLPAGSKPLSEAVLVYEREWLLRALDELQHRFIKQNISHNNLTRENIVVDRCGCLHPLRQYYTSVGYGGDEKSFAELRAWICENSNDESCDVVCENFADYGIEDFALVENRRMVSDDNGVGFEDGDGVLVIECKYMWASHFQEGRAIVATHGERYGIIDKSGNEILKPIYDVVYYDIESGETWAMLNERVAKFGYDGKCLTEWITQEEFESRYE